MTWILLKYEEIQTRNIEIMGLKNYFKLKFITDYIIRFELLFTVLNYLTYMVQGRNQLGGLGGRAPQ